MPRAIDYDGIIDNLAQKTEQGKLEWKPTVEENVFICVLEEGEFTFRVNKYVYEEEDYVALSMTDKTGTEIFRLSFTFGYQNYRKLFDLYEIARRSALDVEGKVNQVSDILRRI